jgi:glycosyltransferase involved in cell wall biosynthesis
MSLSTLDPAKAPATATGAGPPPLRAALLFPSGHLSVAPTARYLAAGLARHGFAVDFYTARNRWSPPPAVEHDAVRVFVMPGEQQRLREPIYGIVLMFLAWSFYRCLRRRPDVLVGCGIRGLFVASLISLFLRRPVVYHSMELYPSWEWKSLAGRFYKAVERWCNRRARASLIQDPMRAGILAADNRIAPDSIVIFPVAPFGPARRQPATLLRDRFRIAPETRIILHAGGVFAGFSLAPQVVTAAQEWPADWVLVMHCNQRPEDAGRLEQLRQLDRAGRVVFSLEPVPAEQVPDLIASADVGLAVYARADDNIYHLGLSSGKLGEYLRCGVPVVASDFPGVRDLIEESHAGLCVPDAAAIGPAIAAILASYDGYVAGALRCFDRKLALENYMGEVAGTIARVAAR